MNYNPNDMRSIINIINESVELTEAPLSQKIKNGIARTKAAMGSNAAKGEVDSIELANKLDAAFKQYLGRTGKKGTLKDIANFLVSPSVGFDKNSVMNILKPKMEPMVNGNQNQDDSQENPEPQPQQEQPEPEENNQETETEAPASNDPEPEEPTTQDSEEPSEADDSIDEGINQILTYTNARYARNMSNETASKIKKAAYTIINNIPEASPESIKKGGNAVLNAMAVLDSSGSIDTGQNGRIQDYINKILSMDLSNGEKPKEFNDNGESEENPNDDIDTDDIETPAPNQNKDEEEKPEEKENTNNTTKPRVRVPATTRPVQENSGLSDADIYDIFKQAAQYAYANDMVGGSRNNTFDQSFSNDQRSYGNNRSNSGNQQRSSGFDGNMNGLDKQDQRFMDKVNNKLRNMGITNDEFDARLDLARIDSFDAIHRQDDIRSLAAIGYAFLKSIPK